MLMRGVVFFMKKFLVFVCLVALFSFSGLAFIEAADYYNPDAVVETVPAADYYPSIDYFNLDDHATNDVTMFDTHILSISANAPTPYDFNADNIYLPKETADKVVVMTNIKMNFTLEPSSAINRKIYFRNYTDTRTSNLYAFIKAKPGSYYYEPDMYYAFKCEVTGEEFFINIDYPEEFFSENTIVIATVETTGSGSGGCNAGYAGLLLLAAVPFLLRKKK